MTYALARRSTVYAYPFVPAVRDMENTYLCLGRYIGANQWLVWARP